MDDTIGRQILEEMRRQRRLGWVSIVILVLFIGAFAAHIMVLRKQHSAPPPPSWPQVRSAIDADNCTKALQIAQTLIGNRIDHDYGEAYLGAIYRRMGDMENAKIHYARAYELYPSEEHEKNLFAIQKALEFKNRPATN